MARLNPSNTNTNDIVGYDEGGLPIHRLDEQRRYEKDYGYLPPETPENVGPPSPYQETKAPVEDIFGLQPDIVVNKNEGTTGSGLPPDIAKQKQDYLDNYRGIQQEVGMPKKEEFTPRKSEWDLFSDSLLGFVGGLIVSGGNPLAGAFMATAAYMRGSDYNYRYDQLGNIEGVGHFGKQQWLMDGDTRHLVEKKKKEVGTIERFNNDTNSFDTYTLFDDGTHSTKSVEKETKWGNINLADGRKVAVKLKANGEFDLSGIDFNKKDANGKTLNEWSDSNGAIKARVIDEDTYNAAKERELGLYSAKKGMDFSNWKLQQEYTESKAGEGGPIKQGTVVQAINPDGQKRSLFWDNGWKDVLTRNAPSDLDQWTMEKPEAEAENYAVANTRITDTDEGGEKVERVQRYDINSDRFIHKVQPSLNTSQANALNLSVAGIDGLASALSVKEAATPEALRRYIDTLAPNWYKNPSHSQFTKGIAQSVMSIMRDESGAAIGIIEKGEYVDNYVPLPGDSVQVITDKLERLEGRLQTMARKTGNAYEYVSNYKEKKLGSAGAKKDKSVKTDVAKAAEVDALASGSRGAKTKDVDSLIKDF